MSGKLPALKGADVVRLGASGVHGRQSSGSHHFMRHPDGRATVVAVHAGETIGPGLLAKILRDVGMDREEFRKLL